MKIYKELKFKFKHKMTREIYKTKYELSMNMNRMFTIRWSLLGCKKAHTTIFLAVNIRIQRKPLVKPAWLASLGMFLCAPNVTILNSVKSIIQLRGKLDAWGKRWKKQQQLSSPQHHGQRQQQQRL